MKQAICVRPMYTQPDLFIKGVVYLIRPSKITSEFVEVYDKLGNRLGGWGRGGKENEFLANRFKLLTDRKGLDHYA